MPETGCDKLTASSLGGRQAISRGREHLPDVALRTNRSMSFRSAHRSQIVCRSAGDCPIKKLAWIWLDALHQYVGTIRQQRLQLVPHVTAAVTVQWQV